MLVDLSACLCCTLLCLSVIADAESLQVLYGYRPILEVTSKRTALGPLNPSQNLHLAIGLPLRDLEGLNRTMRELYDPGSPRYHHWMQPQELAAKFCATADDYKVVIDWAKAHGLTVTATHPNRLVVEVEGSVAAVQKSCHITLRVYNHPSESRTFFAPNTNPSVDVGVPILTVDGLDSYDLPHSSVRRISAGNGDRVTPNGSPMRPDVGSGPGGAYAPCDFRAAYVPGTTLQGLGQNVGLVEFDDFYNVDISNYETQFGLPNLSPMRVVVNGPMPAPSVANAEVCLDIEMVLAMSPGVSAIYVYQVPNSLANWLPLLSRIQTDNLCKQVSCSWHGGGYNAAGENVFLLMAAQGQSVFNATDDQDAFLGFIPFPSTSPNITQVGGTTLTTTGPCGAYSSEVVWNQGSGRGSSGGYTNIAIPWWQEGIDMTANLGSTLYRNVPDVALTADNVYVKCDNGGERVISSTSCAPPLWAGFLALVNEQASRSFRPGVGFLNPVLYSLGKSPAYNSYFHDTTVGNNQKSGSGVSYAAQPGYDLCTGWGTPAGQPLIDFLAGTSPGVPNGGFEIGDFSFWTQWGNTQGNISGVGSVTVHSGNFGAFFGAVGSLGGISQELTTVPGQTYVLSFWAANFGSSQTEMLVSCNGTLVDMINPPTFGWSNFQFTVTADSTTSLLEFGFRNDPSFFYLDDITFTPMVPVVTNPKDSGPGSLRDVIAGAMPGDTITFAPGLSGTITLTGGELSISKSLTINGPGANLLTVSGNNASGVFHVHSGTVSISGFTIANTGYPNSGVRNESGANLTLSNCTVRDNTGLYGGGIYNVGSLTVHGCTFVNNSSTDGGAIYTYGMAKIVNSTIAGNHINGANNWGGGIEVDGGTLAVTCCTIAGNGTPGNTLYGGGIRTDFDTTTILNTIVAGNIAATGPDVYGPVTSQGCNLIGAADGSTGWNQASNTPDQLGSIATPINPKLGPLQDNGGPTPTMALLAGSPAIDKGYVGANVLDQQQTQLTGSAGGLDQWQSFTAGKSGQLTQIALAVGSPVAPASSPGTISIYAGEGINGPLLATIPVTFVDTPPGGFQTFSLGSTPFLTTGDQYTIRLSVPTVTIGWVGISSSNPYSGGRASADPSWDLLFKTYVTLGPTSDQRGNPRPFDVATIPNANGGDGSDIGAFELIPPTLRMAVSGGNSILSWSTNSPAYTLETTSSLNPPTWTPVLDTPVIDNGEYTLSISQTSGDQQFFRLAADVSSTALSFDGSSSYVSIGALPIPAPWTAEFWVNRQDTPNYSASLLGDASTALKLEQFNFSRKVGFTQFGVADYTFDYSAPANTWVHLAFVCDTSTRLYVNGELQGTMAATIPLPLARIGYDSSNYRDYMKGVLDEVRAWNVAKTQEQIQANMNHSLSVPQANLVGYWRFDEGNGTNAFDSSGEGNTGTLQNGPAWVNSSAPLVP